MSIIKNIKSNWSVFKDDKALESVLAQKILYIAKKSIEKNDKFSIVLTGGLSIIGLYRMLARSDSDWKKWHIYIGDERCSLVDNKDRNDMLINKVWLCNNLIPKDNIYFFKPELGLLEVKKEYEKILKRVDKFDIVLLSIGDDGHIASLFPNHIYPKDQDVVIECHSPKPPKERISMSYKRLNEAHNIFKIIMGKSKRPIVKLLLQGDFFPVNLVNGEMERVFIQYNAIPGEYKE